MDVRLLDDAPAGEFMGAQLSAPFDLLLGRRSYDVFAAYWPDVRRATRYRRRFQRA